MDVIGHEDEPPHEPAITRRGIPPQLGQAREGVTICEQGTTPSGAGSEVVQRVSREWDHMRKVHGIEGAG